MDKKKRTEPKSLVQESAVEIPLSEERIQRFWEKVTKKTAMRIEPYERARALSLAEAGQHVCR